MPEFLKLETGWLNVDKIARVENHGTPERPDLLVHLQPRGSVRLQGIDAVTLMTYMNANKARWRTE